MGDLLATLSLSRGILSGDTGSQSMRALIYNGAILYWAAVMQHVLGRHIITMEDTHLFDSRCACARCHHAQRVCNNGQLTPHNSVILQCRMGWVHIYAVGSNREGCWPWLSHM